MNKRIFSKAILASGLALAGLTLSANPAIAQGTGAAPPIGRTDFSGKVMIQNYWQRNMALGLIEKASDPGVVRVPDVIQGAVAIMIDITTLPSVSEIRSSGDGGRQTGAAVANARWARAGASWLIEPAGDMGRFKIKSGQLPGLCLASNPQLGVVFSRCEPTDPRTLPPLWVFEADLSEPSVYRIRRDGTNDYLNIETGQLASGAIEPGWWSAKWVILSSNIEGRSVPNLWDNFKP